MRSTRPEALVAGAGQIDDAAKANLYNYLTHEREGVLAKLDGLCEYDVRRPLTVTGPTCWARSSI
jgi:hypothetical protein